ncbi:geranylgeranylglycerol-phosphate geranylgeranyltransferase [Flavobacterium sp. MFBS3-15]|uniref:geranylgeranylglycerol-phosphate geranylgeranyltransferase n=1 Tax=Flavobacterium sp. MFBS3-15 TaxID=2989816 RepID=UPI0022364885|nr:geranylgeranylglycerol-phosphate geranylgeranyltransferase [Flavobacterium sp. MFBS3-15]MCW4468231.1 geranylgeranylglycerol-phosphate geranylgeranyltransferase [Flavobacterium sp. MFBS3-15]
MASRKSRLTRMKVLSMFSVVRGYNIPIIALAQYLSAIFILAPEERALDVILDLNLFFIVLASSLTIASGYIINNFYDAQKDLINRPKKSMLDRLVSQGTKLRVYFLLNFIVFLLAWLVSWRAALFFSAYIFLIWLYSHKLKRYPLIGNLTAALLAVLPFFGILMYFKNFYQVIFAHATFLFLLILTRELIKDLENLKGDIVADYRTIPVMFGERTAKAVIMGLTFLTVIPVFLLIDVYDVGYMDIYFYSGMIVIIYFLSLLWKAENQKDYLRLHNILKFLIVTGVFCIVLIDPSVVVHGRKLLSMI